jgi:hypothetical protein
VPKTVAQLSVVCKPGAIIVAEVDLKTHSRWIRDKDPNNIYRYSNAVYNALWFRGIPNRLRPYQYREMFESHGWTDASTLALERIADRANAFAPQFRDARNQMDFLSMVLCAKKI